MGRFYQTTNPRQIDFAYELPVNLMAGAIEKADQGISKFNNTLGDLEAALKVDAIQQDKPRLSELLGAYESKIDDLAGQIQSDPLAFKRLNPNIRDLTRTIQSDLNKGELSAIQSRHDFRAKSIDEAKRLIAKSPDKFRTSDLDKLVDHFDNVNSPIQFNNKTGTFNQYEIDQLAKFVNVEDLGEKRGSGYMSDIVSRSGYSMKQMGDGSFIVTTNGGREVVKEEDIMRDLRSAIKNDPDLQRFHDQQMKIGAMTQGEIDNQTELVARRIASKYGYRKDKLAFSVKANPFDLQKRAAKARAVERGESPWLGINNSKIEKEKPFSSMGDFTNKQNGIIENINRDFSNFSTGLFDKVTNLAKSKEISPAQARELNRMIANANGALTNIRNAHQAGQPIKPEHFAAVNELSSFGSKVNQFTDGKHNFTNSIVNDQIDKMIGRFSTYQSNAEMMEGLQTIGKASVLNGGHNSIEEAMEDIVSNLPPRIEKRQNFNFNHTPLALSEQYKSFLSGFDKNFLSPKKAIANFGNLAVAYEEGNGVIKAKSFTEALASGDIAKNNIKVETQIDDEGNEVPVFKKGDKVLNMTFGKPQITLNNVTGDAGFDVMIPVDVGEFSTNFYINSANISNIPNQGVLESYHGQISRFYDKKSEANYKHKAINDNTKFNAPGSGREVKMEMGNGITYYPATNSYDIVDPATGDKHVDLPAAEAESRIFSNMMRK